MTEILQGLLRLGRPEELLAELQRQKSEGARQDAKSEFQERYWSDPVSWAKEVVRWRPGQGVTEYQEQILGAIVPKKRVCVRAPHGAGKCVAAGDLIQLATGEWEKAGSLIGKTFAVLAVDDDLRVHVADASAEDNGRRDVVEITTDKGRVVTRTLEHPLWGDLEPRRYVSSEGRKRLRPVGDWVPAGDLRPGAVICLHLGHEVPRPGVNLSDSEIKLAAYLIANGGLTNGTPIFSNPPGRVLEEFEACCATIGCAIGAVDPRGIDRRVIASSNVGGGKNPNPLKTRLRDWGIDNKCAREKAFPEWAWRLDSRQLALFLSRLFTCDGWVHTSDIRPKRPGGEQHREIGYCSASEVLARDVQRALLRLGISAEIRHRIAKYTHNGERRQSDAWTVGIHNTENLLRFCARVGFFGQEEAICRIEEACLSANNDKTQRWRSCGLPGHFRWETVRAVRILRDQPTVSIQVPHYHTFLTEFVEHNTTFMALATLWFATTRDGFDWKIVTTASNDRQLKEFLWPEIHKWARRLRWEIIGRKPFNERDELLTKELRLRTGQAFAATATDAAGIEGAHADHLLYVFDESKAIPGTIFDAAEGAFSGGNTADTEAYALCVSTPGEPAGRFWEIQTNDKGRFGDWHAVAITKEDLIRAGRMTEAWAKWRAAQWGETSFVYLNRVEGKFAAQGKDGVIPQSWVEAAEERWQLNQDAPLNGIITFGVDVADEEGSDRSVVAVRVGKRLVETHDWVHQDTMGTVQRVVELFALWRPERIAVDAIGIGAGVVSRLRELGFPVHAFVASQGEAATDLTGEIGYHNLRAAAWWSLRERLHPQLGEGLELGGHDLLLPDLTAPTWRMPGRKIIVEAKEEIRKRLRKQRGAADGGSTDVGDAVVMAFWDGGGGAYEDAYSPHTDATLRAAEAEAAGQVDPHTGQRRRADAVEEAAAYARWERAQLWGAADAPRDDDDAMPTPATPGATEIRWADFDIERDRWQ